MAGIAQNSRHVSWYKYIFPHSQTRLFMYIYILCKLRYNTYTFAPGQSLPSKTVSDLVHTWIKIHSVLCPPCSYTINIEVQHSAATKVYCWQASHAKTALRWVHWEMAPDPGQAKLSRLEFISRELLLSSTCSILVFLRVIPHSQWTFLPPTYLACTRYQYVIFSPSPNRAIGLCRKLGTSWMTKWSPTC
jgi:hypothetical protein